MFILCRIVIEECFEEHSELDQILKFSSPKVLRLIDILRRIRPLHFVDPRNRNRDNIASEHLKEALPENEVSEIPEENSSSDSSEEDTCKGVIVETKLENYSLDHVIKQATVTEVTDEDIARLTNDGWFSNELCQEIDRPSSADTDEMIDDSPAETLINKRLKLLNDIDDESVESFQSCMERLDDLGLEDPQYVDNVQQNTSSIVQISPDLAIKTENSLPTNRDCLPRSNKRDGCDTLKTNGMLTPDVFSSCTASPVKCRDTKHPNTLVTINGDASVDSSHSIMAVNESSSSSDDDLLHNETVVRSSSKCDLGNLTNGNHSIRSTVSTSNINIISNVDNCSEIPEDIVKNDKEDVSFSVPNGISLIQENSSSTDISDVNDAAEHCDTRPPARTANASANNGYSARAMAATGSYATTAQQHAYRGNKRRKGDIEVKEKVKVHNPDDPDSVCGLIFVSNCTTAKMLYRLLKVTGGNEHRKCCCGDPQVA